jgi:hypothetical protein
MAKTLAVVAVSGAVTRSTFEGDKPSLTLLKKLVGGKITVFQLNKYQVMVVNEEGLLLGLPPNGVASLLAGQALVGPAVIVEAADM